MCPQPTYCTYVIIPHRISEVCRLDKVGVTTYQVESGIQCPAHFCSLSAQRDHQTPPLPAGEIKQSFDMHCTHMVSLIDRSPMQYEHVYLDSSLSPPLSPPFPFHIAY